MAHRLYDTPNHPRWDDLRTEPPTDAASSRWELGRARSLREDHRTPRGDGADSPPLLSREETDDEATLELASSPDWVRITAELPDASVDDVRLTCAGRSLRIRADPSTGETGIDRTIALTENFDPAGVAVAYCDPALTVIVPKRT